MSKVKISNVNESKIKGTKLFRGYLIRVFLKSINFQGQSDALWKKKNWTGFRFLPCLRDGRQTVTFFRS